MKRILRILSLLMTIVLLTGSMTMFVTAAPKDVTGTAKSGTEAIKINDTDTGVTLTQMLLSSGSTYSKSADGVVNVIEVDLSDKVTMKVLNGGSYNWSTATMGKSAVAYNTAHDDSTVIAAVNGDPWLVYHTDYDGDGQKATGAAVKHVSVSRGIMVIEGELWASHQIDDENNLARTDNAERGTPAARGPVFAIKADGSAMIGTPTLSFSTKTSSGSAITINGLNRLPAPNSIILYNQRCGTESFAMEDAYEIYLECSNTAFSIGGSVTGKVIAIYQSGQTGDRPAIDEKTVVVSARGTSINRIKDKFKVGDSMTINCTVTSDITITAQKNDWNGVKEAIGSFFFLLDRGTVKGQPGNQTNYPCSIIGLTKEGKVIVTTTTATEDGTRNACRMTDLPALCKELGYHSAILFDGGGSTTMVTLSGDKYVRRSSAVDGNNSVRGVISGIAVVYNGVNAEPKNDETNYTRFYEALGIEQELPPELPEGVDFVGAPSYSYRYYVKIDTINGNQHDNLIGRRNPEIWDTGDKAGSIDPGIVNNLELSSDRKLILSGYAFVNGGQGDHYWSTDLENWHLCTDGVYTDGDATIEGIATEGAAMNSTNVTNARFENVTADLSEYAGQVVTVYFGITAKADKSKICSYLSVSGVAVPSDETEAPTEEPTEPVTDPVTEAPTEAPTEVPTEAPTEAPTTPVTTPETETTADESGCASTLVVGVFAILLPAVALVLGKKRKK